MNVKWAVAIILAFLSFATLAGCGQSGPLFLPPPGKAAQK